MKFRPQLMSFEERITPDVAPGGEMPPEPEVVVEAPQTPSSSDPAGAAAGAAAVAALQIALENELIVFVPVNGNGQPEPDTVAYVPSPSYFEIIAVWIYENIPQEIFDAIWNEECFFAPYPGMPRNDLDIRPRLLIGLPPGMLPDPILDPRAFEPGGIFGPPIYPTVDIGPLPLFLFPRPVELPAPPQQTPPEGN